MNKIKDGKKDGEKENRKGETQEKEKKDNRERKDIICQRWCLSVLSVKEKTTSEEERG